MPDIKAIADRADMIVNGYAFERQPDGIHVLNLKHPDKASVFNNEDEAIETTMDDIEISIVRKYLIANRIYMED